MLKIIAIAGLLALGACAQTGGATVVNRAGLAGTKERIQEFTRADAETALALAERTNDVLAIQCFSYLVTKVSNTPALLPEEQADDRKIGILTSFQIARTINRVRRGLVSIEYRRACGPMVMESREAVRRGILKRVIPF